MRQLIALIALFAGGALAQPAATQFLLRIEPVRTDFTLQNATPEEARLAGQHLQYLMSLAEAGKLNMAAQVFDPKGLWGFIVLDAPDQETARAVLDADPMVKAKMFRGEVFPMRVVLEKPARPAKPAVAVDAKTLESYSGTYKSEQIPLDIKVSAREGKLFLQATGQPEFSLQAISATQFEFAAAGIVVEFDSPASFTLKQRGVNSKFTKAAAVPGTEHVR